MQITEADIESARARGYLLGKEGAEKLAAVELADLRRQLDEAEADIRQIADNYVGSVQLRDALQVERDEARRQLAAAQEENARLVADVDFLLGMMEELRWHKREWPRGVETSMARLLQEADARALLKEAGGDD